MDMEKAALHDTERTNKNTQVQILQTVEEVVSEERRVKGRSIGN